MSRQSLSLFLLGQPGSGKSSIEQEIERYVEQKPGWSTSYINDYGILCQMYQKQDSWERPKQFEPGQYGGFTVLDPAVYDEALRELKRQVEELELQTSREKNHLSLIEFARSDYQHAFQVLGADFLQGVSFLFLDVDIEVCKSRVIQRVHKFKDDKSRNDYYVPGKVFDRYLVSNNSQYFLSQFREEYQIPESRLKIITNDDALQEALTEIKNFVDGVLTVEPVQVR